MTAKGQKEEKLPRIIDVLSQLMRPGTVLTFPEKPITFPDTQQQAVKTLMVNICSTETEDMQALHKLNTQVREL